ncbi:MAG: peptide chain release factor 1 [Candidatus Omnitrophota bacterium]|nr:peptide chain release factor 1 [Candidatus Omnitrophota bacterium]
MYKKMINVDKLKEEHRKISEELSSPDVTKDRERYQQLAKRFSFLEKVLNLEKLRTDCLKEKEHLEAVFSNPKEAEEFRGLAKEELGKLEVKVKSIEEDIEDKLFASQEPQRDVIIEIRAAAGGEESALFASDLFKMYSRYVEKNGWKLETLDSSPTDIGGFKEIVFSVSGEGAYAHLKFESGVHRVQRVPNTEASGRVHTSTVTVVILIEPKEVELNINPDDLKIETFRASGKGGQHVNRTDSAVRITHVPTGTVAGCQDERSQGQNKEKAMRVLKARILEKMEREANAKITSARRVQIGTGERSEKIRTYNFPERRLTDHRINFTIYQLDRVLEGDLDEVIKKLIQEERKKLYELKGLV